MKFKGQEIMDLPSEGELMTQVSWRDQNPVNQIKVYTAVLDTIKDRYPQKCVQNVRNVLSAVLKLAGDSRTVEELERVEVNYDDLTCLQARIYSMFGPGFGMVARFAIQQPAVFYIDARCAKTVYSRKEIYAEVDKLKGLAEKAGLDPRHMNSIDFHNCGIW
jgi:predicted P-loop ATPase